jgi:hypothetical protein
VNLRVGNKSRACTNKTVQCSFGRRGYVHR